MKAPSGAAAAALLLLLFAPDAADGRRAPAAACASAGAPLFSRTLDCEGGGAFVVPRGGATLVDEEYDSEDVDEYDSEDDEEEEVVRVIPAKLSKSTVQAARKSKAKKAAATKEAIGATLTKTKPKKRRPSLAKALHVPYIIRACLNPITFFAMMRAYFASLFNIDYLVQDSSQNLRSALEEKAKKDGKSGGRKPKRTFKPGQAKTLSDLPQLSA